MSNVLRNRARRTSRLTHKERAADLEKVLAVAEAALSETQDGIDQALQHFYDAADILESLLPAEEDPAAEERERVIRQTLDDLTHVRDLGIVGDPELDVLIAEKLVEVMDAIEALPAVKWPEAPIGEDLPQWMLDAIAAGIRSTWPEAGGEIFVLHDAIAAELSQKGNEKPGPQAVENTEAAEA